MQKRTDVPFSPDAFDHIGKKLIERDVIFERRTLIEQLGPWRIWYGIMQRRPKDLNQNRSMSASSPRVVNVGAPGDKNHRMQSQRQRHHTTLSRLRDPLACGN